MDVTSNQYHSVLYKYKNARYSIFTDMVENSMLDLIVVSNKGPYGELDDAISSL